MAGKRGNGQGSIRQRKDGRWEALVSLPDGTRKSLYASTFREVERKLAQARRDIEGGLQVIDNRQTFAQYLASWFESSKHRFKVTTRKRYRTQIDCHILPALGKVVLSKLTVQRLQDFYTSKLDSGFGISTVQNMHTVIHSALDQAVRIGLLQRNVADLVQLPGRPRTKQVSLTDEEVQRFLEGAKEERLEALFILALSTGMREGELLGLLWDNVDLDAGMLVVKTNLIEGEGGKRVLDEPKTSHSRRRIALSEFAVSALRAHRERQDKAKELMASKWDNKYNLVFPNTLGKPMHPRHLLYRDLPRILNRAGLPRMRIHDLRHAAATILLRHKVNPKIVSEMLGHAHIGITLDIYSHVTPDMQQESARVMNNVFQPQKKD